MRGIVDAHIHIWRQADLPWLSGPMVPRIFGPYEPLRRDYPIEEYLADVRDTGIERAVYVQANWHPARSLEEVEWVAGEARRVGFPLAIVAFADLSVEDATPALEALARHPEVRGIRQQLHWHANPAWRFAARPDLPSDPRLIENVRRLSRFGFLFELLDDYYPAPNAAFFIAEGFLLTGLGRRIALLFVRRLGKSSLGLAYGMALTDLILAPATPSNTARNGGDLGGWKKGDLRKEIEDLIWDKDRNYVTDPIRTENGYLILKKTAHHQAGLALLEEVENEIMGRLYGPRFEPKVREYLTELRQQAFLEIKDGWVDTAAAPGKDTKWTDPARLTPETVTKEEVLANPGRKRLLWIFPVPGTQRAPRSISR